MGNDNLLWRFEPHTLAKHKILKKYIEAWAPILGSSTIIGRIVYIDGFAGPGEDITHKHYGSPLIAIESLINHKKFSDIHSEIIMVFIEKRKDRKEHLESIIKQKFPSLPNNLKYTVIEGDFNSVMRDILNNLKNNNKRLAPTFCFVDPFGWSDINLDLLAEFMEQDKAELLITFMAGFMKRSIDIPEHYDTLKTILTDEEIEEAKLKHSNNRTNFIAQRFLLKLKNKISKKIYDISFETRDKNNNVLYYLIYLTSHIAGMKAMKEAMYYTSHNGEFYFSDFDFDPHQTTLINYGLSASWFKNAADELYSYIRSQNKLLTWLDVEEVKNYVYLYTHYTFRNGIFKYLEDAKKIEVSGDRKKGTYPKKVKIRFL
ncbi:MAG: three-Cys-motif partner protein TcmP [Thermoplasmata archaeon]|jgi:three-Cys-motif partner protein